MDPFLEHSIDQFNKKITPSLKNPEVLFLSFFGVGLIPKAPGTFGTAAILPLLYYVGKFDLPWPFFVPVILVTTLVSCFVAQVAQKKFNAHDPGWIVIDEVLGMSITWLFCSKHTFLELMIAFALFRFFDIVKIWPANYVDQNFKHGAATILDDIVSAIYAGIIVLLLNRFMAY